MNCLHCQVRDQGCRVLHAISVFSVWSIELQSCRDTISCHYKGRCKSVIYHGKDTSCLSGLGGMKGCFGFKKRRELSTSYERWLTTLAGTDISLNIPITYTALEDSIVLSRSFVYRLKPAGCFHVLMDEWSNRSFHSLLSVCQCNRAKLRRSSGSGENPCFGSDFRDSRGACWCMPCNVMLPRIWMIQNSIGVMWIEKIIRRRLYCLQYIPFLRNLARKHHQTSVGWNLSTITVRRSWSLYDAKQILAASLLCMLKGL